VLSGTGAELLNNDGVRQAYLGIRAPSVVSRNEAAFAEIEFARRSEPRPRRRLFELFSRSRCSLPRAAHLLRLQAETFPRRIFCRA
jgi:hypothetical protein